MSVKTPTISEIIIARIKAAGGAYKANNNISEFIEEGELQMLEDEAVVQFAGMLRTLVIDPNDPNSKDTPRRLAKMYLNEVMWGRYTSMPDVKAFPNDEDDEGYYTGLQVNPAEITSLCSHHHQTVSGVAYVGVLPGVSMMGLSKFSRIADWYARRGTLQEELTRDIALAVAKESKTDHVAVTILARHGCCENRGIRAHNSETATNYMLGDFMNRADLRQEYMSTMQMLHAKRGG